jgi:MFS transporter, CP family, cyanate transporter
VTSGREPGPAARSGGAAGPAGAVGSEGRAAAAGTPRSASGLSTAGITAGGGLLVGGLLAVAFNLRLAITSLPPVYPELSAAAGYSTASLSVLAAVPVLSFAAFSGLAPALARRFGDERVIGLSLLMLAAGLGLRSAAPAVLLFPATIVASCAIAFMNVLLPSLVKRRRPDLAGLFIGLYMTSLTVGAVIAAAAAVPLYNAAGGGQDAVRLTLGIWAIPALLAAVIWLPQLRFRTAPSPAEGRRGVLAMARHALAWQVTAFMGLQSLSYYATLSWFPTMLRDHGISAGAAGNLLALMNVGNALMGLLVPVLAQRARDQRLLSAAAVALIVIGLVGSAFGPNAAAVVFVTVLGLGQGSAFSLAVFLFAARAADSHTAAGLSGFAQSIGYLIAAAGPLLLGLLHEATSGWTVPVGVLLAAAAGQLAAGLLAGRARTIGPSAEPADPLAAPG